MCLFFSSAAFISPQESLKQHYLSPPLTRIFIPLWQWCSYSTVCVWYLRVSQQLLYVTDRFYGTFGYSTLLFFLSYQHLVTRSQEGAHTAKCILKIDAASEVWKLRPWRQFPALMLQLVSCCYKLWPDEGSMDLINNAMTVRSTSGHRQACKN